MTRSLRASAPSRAPRPAPVESVRPAPEAWSLARLWADGDVRRLEPLPDGSVLVRNRPRTR
jgi:hypothetical protein